MKEYTFKNSSFIIFTVISVWYLIGNFIWWCLNTPFISMDGASAIHFMDVFKKTLLCYNAPLITWIMKIMFYVFGKESFDLQIIVVNYFFFLIGLYFIYKIGLEIKDKETGNISMILFALTPAVYGMSRQYGHQDWHVMIAMTANIYCLIKLNYFNNRKWSILYGITVGLGLLIKDAFLMFFSPPWLYVVIRSLINKTDKDKIINILITIIVGSLIAGCHYFRTEIIYKVLHEPINETAPIFCFDSLRITTVGLSEYLLSPPIFIFVFIGLIYFMFFYKNKSKLIILIWIIIPWLIIILMPARKVSDYLLGFIPALLLIVSIFISELKIIYKRVFLVLLITLLIFQFCCFSYDKTTENFYFSFKYKNNEIYYFSNTVTKINSSTKALFQYLKKFPNYSVYIEGENIDQFVFNLLNCMNGLNIEINDFFDIQMFYEGQEKSLDIVTKENVIILVKGHRLSDLDIAEHIYSFDMDNLGKNNNYKNSEINKILMRIKIGRKYIEDNFYFIEEFYLENIKNEDNLIKVYKKKNSNEKNKY